MMMSEQPACEELEKRIKDLEQELRLMQETARESRERYQAFFDRSFDAVYIHDFEGRFIDASDAALDMLGYSRSDISSITFTELLTEDQMPKVFQSMKELMNTTSRKEPEEYKVRRKDGTMVWLETKASVIYRGGQPYAVQGIARDITERKRTEELPRHSEERYRTIFENTCSASILIGEDTTILLANSNFEKLTGYSKQELEGRMSWTVFIMDEDLERIKGYHETRRDRQGQVPTSYEFRLRNRNGEIRDIFLNVALIPGSRESIASCIDITERKRSEERLRQSEGRYRNILEGMEEAYYEVDLKGNFTFFNTRPAQRLGYDYDELMGMNFRQYMDEENARKVYKTFHQVFTTGESLAVDWELADKWGHKIYVEASVSLERNADGTPAGFRGVVRDITKRKEAEEALQVSEEKYRTILESMEEAYFESDLKGNFTFFNDSLCKILGYAREELEGMNFRSYYNEDTARQVRQAYKEIYKTGMSRSIAEFDIVRKDGTRRTLEVSASPIHGPSEITGFRFIGRDITERVKARGDLRQINKRLSTLVQAIPDVVYFKDASGRNLEVNRAYEVLTGCSKKELIGKTDEEILPPELAVQFRRSDEEAISKHVPIRFEEVINSPDGKNISFETIKAPIFNDEGTVIGLVGVSRDITERKKSEEALRESEERFRDLAELLPECVFETNELGKLTFVNRLAFERFQFTLEDFVKGMNVFDVIVPEDHVRILENVRKVVQGERIGLNEYTARSKDGTTFSAMVHSTPIMRDGKIVGLRGFLIDISEKKNLEEQLMRAQKMEAIGTLAGGIAHDFNNLLMGILGNVSLLMMKTDDSHPRRDRLKNIEEYVQRGSDLTKQLLGFARGGKYEVKPTDLGEFVRRSSEMFGRTKKEIRIHRMVQDGLWTVELDRGQMEQVLLNLFVNAWQAMPGGGDLYLSVENVHLEESEVSPYELKSGDFVKITVTDTGVGMDEAVKARIFEPFFTTKERGRGTGLGLASVYGIIKNHGGFIHIESEKGAGSSFIIYLPASNKEVEIEVRQDNEVHKGRGTILLIDDEEMILDVGSQMLAGLGYAVLTAKGGGQGIEVYKQNSDGIDLVILDLIMPDVSGNITYDRLKEINPSVKVLLSSGYSLDGQAKEVLEKGCKGFIQKPFSMEALSGKIRGILDHQE
jgi:PAS domain S-box-containing protein